MLLFWKLVDETQISKPQEYTNTSKQNLTCIFLSVRGILKETFQCETPCRWKSQYDWGNTTGWLERIVNILQISHHIFVKLSVCNSMRVIVLRTWSILTLAMPQVKTEQIQNLALFWDCCKRPKSVISGNLSKNSHVWATQWPTSSELKIKFDPSLGWS